MMKFFAKRYLTIFLSVFGVIAVCVLFAGRGFVSQNTPVVAQQNMFIQPKMTAYAERIKMGDVSYSVSVKKIEDQYPYKDLNVLGDGMSKYNVYCQICHGKAGAGFPLNFNLQIEPPRLLNLSTMTDLDIFKKIRGHGYGKMPNFEDQLTIKDSWAIAYYLKNEHLQKEISSLLVDLNNRKSLYIGLNFQEEESSFNKLFFFDIIYELNFYNQLDESSYLKLEKFLSSMLDGDIVSFESFYNTVKNSKLSDKDLNFIFLRIKEKLLMEKQKYSMVSEYLKNPYFERWSDSFFFTEFNADIYNRLLLRTAFGSEDSDGFVGSALVCISKVKGLESKFLNPFTFEYINYDAEDDANEEYCDIRGERNLRFRLMADSMFYSVTQAYHDVTGKISYLWNFIEELEQESKNEEYILIEQCPLIMQDYLMSIYFNDIEDLYEDKTLLEDSEVAKDVLDLDAEDLIEINADMDLEINNLFNCMIDREQEILSGEAYSMFYYADMPAMPARLLIGEIYNYYIEKGIYGMFQDLDYYFEDFYVWVDLLEDNDYLIKLMADDIVKFSANKERVNYQAQIHQLKEDYTQVLTELASLSRKVNQVWEQGRNIKESNTAFLQKSFIKIYKIEKRLEYLRSLIKEKEMLNVHELTEMMGSPLAFEWYMRFSIDMSHIESEIGSLTFRDAMHETMLKDSWLVCSDSYDLWMDEMSYKIKLLNLIELEESIRTENSKDKLNNLIKEYKDLLEIYYFDQARLLEYLRYISQYDTSNAIDFVGKIAKSCIFRGES